MDKSQRWVAIFEKLYFRKPTMDEFVAGKASDFDFKSIQKIGGELPSQPHFESQRQDESVSSTIETHDIQEVTVETTEQPLVEADSHEKASDAVLEETTEHRETTHEAVDSAVENAQEKSPELSDTNEAQTQEQLPVHLVWAKAFEERTGRKPSVEEFLTAKRNRYE